MKAFKIYCMILFAIGTFLWGLVFVNYSYASLGGTIFKFDLKPPTFNAVPKPVANVPVVNTTVAKPTVKVPKPTYKGRIK